jgi:glycosyltransferase involved in cell wall biosynthesis
MHSRDAACPKTRISQQVALSASMTREGANSGKSAPLVSVITPFYNTEQYIAECIESVLAQTYSNWEYILVNNLSSDDSRAIAERYSRKDRRIRLLDTSTHLAQVENFNAALRYMSPESQYCKMVLADDWLFPECIERMVTLAEDNPTVGIVSSYRLFGDEITGEGLPFPRNLVSGHQACQLMLREGYYLTGSPTSILMRADIVRKAQPFYPEGWLHDDTEACFRVLAEHDLGFIHQVLTFSRKDSESLSSGVERFNPGPIRKFMFATKYGPQFFSADEYPKYLRRQTDFYGEFLAASIFEFKPKEFWEFHCRGLRVVGMDFWSLGLPKYVFLEALDVIFNPKKTAGRVLRLIKNVQSKSKELKTPSPVARKQSTNR